MFQWLFFLQPLEESHVLSECLKELSIIRGFPLFKLVFLSDRVSFNTSKGRSVTCRAYSKTVPSFGVKEVKMS